AVAGTLESSDLFVRVSPGDRLEVSIASTVMGQYGDQIEAVVRETLDQLGVTEALVAVDDKGALDFAVRARVQAAVLRAALAKPDWSVL
ncbi:MAG: citrate lyase acyl carrier protein, partial [Actinomycetia bacterium]|nr:citrate lyase acyl carrier protein [Actinomycetes bacterium]